MSGSDYDEVDCPLCCTELDLTDRSIQYCSCGYQMCLWCYHHILEEAAKESLSARCPNCRSVYDQEKITMQHIDAEKLEEEKRKMKEKDRKPGAAEAPKSRANLTNVRVVQPNLVYAVGLPLEICNEDLLRENEYFGQFGKVFKISVNRSNQYASALARHGPTGSAYVTFRRPEDALRCIKLLDGSLWKGKPIKACFGTTKYCNAFLKGLTCNNPDCLYLHELADDADCLTKEEVAAGLLPARFLAMGATNTFKPRLTINPIPNAATAAAQAAAVAAVAAGQPPAAVQAAAAAAGGVSRAGSVTQLPRTAAVAIAPRIVLNDGGGSGAWGSPSLAVLGAAAAGTSAPKTSATWAVAAAAVPAPSSSLPPPPTDDQEWPELGGPAATTAAAAAGGGGPQAQGAPLPDRDESGEGLPKGGSLAAGGGTMAEQIARAHSNPPDKGGAGAGGIGGGKAAKKLLALSSPAKLKALAKPAAAATPQRVSQLGMAAETGTAAAPAEERRKAAGGAATPAAAAAEPVSNGVHAQPPLAAKQQQEAPGAAVAVLEAAPAAKAAEADKGPWAVASRPAHSNGVLADTQPEPESRAAANGSNNGAMDTAAAAGQAGGAAAAAASEGSAAPKPRLPPPGFAGPAGASRAKKLTPPPGFGGPVSNGATPSASGHTSVDSITQLGPEAEAARAAARATAAAGPAPLTAELGFAAVGDPEQQQRQPSLQEGFTPFSTFTGVGGGSLFSSLGSSGSLMERLPSQGDLLAAGSEATSLNGSVAAGPTAAIPITTGRRKSRFKFAQTEGGLDAAAAAAAAQGAPAASLPGPGEQQQQQHLGLGLAGFASVQPAGAFGLQSHSASDAEAAAYNPLRVLQQPPAQQISPSQQDAGAFFKSLFPNVNINVSSALTPPPARQPPPGFGQSGPGLGGYGSMDGNSLAGAGGGLFGAPGAGGQAQGPYPGTSSNTLYNPLAGMFAPQQQPQQQQPQAGAGGLGGLGGAGLSPGLALLRQLQGVGLQQQPSQLQQQQQHALQQQQALQQHALQQQQQLQLGGGFVDPAVMAARPAPPGFGPGLDASSGLYDRSRPAMPPPGFGLQY